MLPLLPEPVAAMGRLQRWTAARPDEIYRLTPREIDRDDPEVWRYVPARHETAHHGKTRAICFGPRCRALLKPLLGTHEANGRGEDDPLFQPRDATAAMSAAKRAARKTPDSCGNRPGTNGKANPKRLPGTTYKVGSYRQAIQRACDKAGVERWSPSAAGPPSPPAGPGSRQIAPSPAGCGEAGRACSSGSADRWRRAVAGPVRRSPSAPRPRLHGGRRRCAKPSAGRSLERNGKAAGEAD